MVTGFQDHFSTVAANYRLYRPHYPSALMDCLHACCCDHDLVWDCATGNGQAAVPLSQHFRHVWATDASAHQISQAEMAPGVSYAVAEAGQSGLADASVDLVVVAQALHWLPMDAFYQEVKRVLKPQGVLAVWCYGRIQVDRPDLQAIFDDLDRIIAPYWPPERHWVDEAYQNIPFPFVEQLFPRFEMRTAWKLSQLLGYVSSWSAVQAWSRQHPGSLLEDLAQVLAEKGVDEFVDLAISWPLRGRLGTLV